MAILLAQETLEQAESARRLRSYLQCSLNGWFGILGAKKIIS